MRRLLGFGVPLAGLVLLASACGGGDDDGGDSGGRAQGVNGVPDGAPFIDQDNLRFSPREVVVEVGETVYFKNSESAIHTVTLDGDNLSGNMNRGDIFEWNPPGVGSYSFTCDFHPQMKATVEVVEDLPDTTTTVIGG